MDGPIIRALTEAFSHHPGATFEEQAVIAVVTLSSLGWSAPGELPGCRDIFSDTANVMISEHAHRLWVCTPALGTVLRVKAERVTVEDLRLEEIRLRQRMSGASQ